MEGGPFDPGFVPHLVINDLIFISPFFDPPGVHPEKHFRPVLGVCPPGTSIDGNDGVPGIILTVQGDFNGEFFDFFSECLQEICRFLLYFLVRFFLGQFQQNLGIFYFGEYGCAGID